jgi:hypothetical protein
MSKPGIGVGDEFETVHCGKCIVTSYKGCGEIMVIFSCTSYSTTVTAGQLRSGAVRDPYVPSTCGVGYLGEGRYSAKILGKNTPAYDAWYNIFRRCYNRGNKGYRWYGGRGVVVCNEWHNFQNFARWYGENSRYGFHIDKDLRIRGSLLYSPETCEFVPKEINILLTNRRAERGKYPIGVSKHEKKFQASLNRGAGSEYLGYFNTPELAFQVYKVAKEKYIKEVAQKYFDQGDISEQAYNTLMNWEIVPYPE